MSRSILLERVYPHPPEKVWRALTDREALAAWLMPNNFAPQVGQRFQFHTAAMPGFSGIVNCEVTLVEPPQRLAYTWQGGPLRRPTLVTWTLEAVPGGTHLRLEQTGFIGAGGWFVRVILRQGWRDLLARAFAQWLDAHG